jgi:putative nucleotidyltransferase with HDIG domain
MNRNFKLPDLRALTPSPDRLYFDWNAIENLCDELRELKFCLQDKIFHAEGDVATHTRMVLEQLVDGKAWKAMSDDDQFKMFWAAVFHDIGKPGTTEVDENGRVSSVGHSKLGAAIARDLMRSAGFDLVLREEICSIISAHQLPFWLYERDNASKMACQYSLAATSSQLLAHAEADARGRICHDLSELLLKIDLSKEVFLEMGVLDRPFEFANDESRFAYFEKDDRSPWYEAHEDYRCEVTLVCGLPGTGKDTWISQNLSGLPVVSLDRLREDLDIDPSGNQGKIIQAGLEEARKHLRASRDFVWNAVNVTKLNREKITRLLRDYNARIKIVYLEVEPSRLMKQNHERKATVPIDVINRLARKLQPPSSLEGHCVEWYYEGNLVSVNGVRMQMEVFPTI